jgi:hypothetical protein
MGMATQELLYGNVAGVPLFEDRAIGLDYFTNRALTDGEMATLETLVTQLQIDLGR